MASALLTKYSAQSQSYGVQLATTDRFITALKTTVLAVSSTALTATTVNYIRQFYLYVPYHPHNKYNFPKHH
jgi:hypothetical protein